MQPISGNHQLVGYEEDPEHDGGVTEALPQKSAGVVPQNPYFEHQTFSGQDSAVDHCDCDLRSQFEMQF